MADLLSLCLTLQPLEAPDPTDPLPQWWGRAAHALLLNVTRQYNPSLAEQLHEAPDESGQAIRPFTTSTLVGNFDHGALDPQGRYALRLTSFHHPLTHILLEAAQEGPLAVGAQVELDRRPFQILAARSQPLAEGERPVGKLDGWADLQEYPQLSASLLLAKEPPPRRLRLRFASPASFKSGGKHIPLPLPELVFGSLLEKWNAFAPVAFPTEARRYAAECLAIGRYELSSRAVGGKNGGLRVGGVGWVSFTTLNYDRYWMSVMGVLARFAAFAGVGAGVAQGMGQCRLEYEPA
ncbi:MAG: CRISPR system precrRNA processing endoribonuclease RAMP protein Cas6 [Anaerolineales bacterium]|nr:CRISPR system precrRNA processing endoribonuclease RAMP protein Cas6 [Anaerolineales bacterium]